METFAIKILRSAIRISRKWKSWAAVGTHFQKYYNSKLFITWFYWCSINRMHSACNFRLVLMRWMLFVQFPLKTRRYLLSSIITWLVEIRYLVQFRDTQSLRIPKNNELVATKIAKTVPRLVNNERDNGWRSTTSETQDDRASKCKGTRKSFVSEQFLLGPKESVYGRMKKPKVRSRYGPTATDGVGRLCRSWKFDNQNDEVSGKTKNRG